MTTILQQAKQVSILIFYENQTKSIIFTFFFPANPKVVFNLRKNSPKDHLLPDGMTIDDEGNIYVATFNGHTIYKVNPK